MSMQINQALQAYGATRKAAGGASPDGARPDGAGSIGLAAEAFAETLRSSEAAARQSMTGGADPHALVEALANTQLAVETAVTVRDRVVEAYQEILRMPV